MFALNLSDSVLGMRPTISTAIQLARLRLPAFVVIAGVALVALGGVITEGSLDLRIEGAAPHRSALYRFALTPLNVIAVIAIVIAPLLLGWSRVGRAMGGWLLRTLLAKTMWWLWPCYVSLMAWQLFGVPVSLLLWAVCLAEVIQWSLWRVRARWLPSLARWRRRFAPRRAPLRLATVFLVVAMLGSWLVTGYTADWRLYMSDTIAQLSHAKVVQQGRFSLEAPPAPEFFRDAFMVCDGRWRSQFPPGHILALAAFDRVGLLEWLAPVAAGVIAALFFSLGVRLYGGHVAVLSTVLLVASPFFVLQFSEAMNHTTTLAWFMAFLWAYDRGARDGSMRWGALAGFSAGAMIATRPLTAACLIGAWTLWDVVRFVVQWRNRDTRRRFIRLWGGATLGGLAPIAFLLYFNDVTNGSLFLFGYIAKQGASHLLGFDAWVGNGHTPAIGLTQGLNNVQSLGVDFLHGWPVYGFVFIAALLLIGRPTALDARMMTTAFALSLGYFFYWYQDSMFGPRFLFEALPLYIWLSTRGIEECARLTSRVARVSPSSAWRSISVLVVLLALFSFRQTHARLSHEAVRNEGFRDKVMEAVDSALSRPNAAIFVGARRSSLAYVRNFDGKEPRVLYDLGDEANARYMRARPDLEFWLYRVNELRCLTPDD